MYGVGQQTENGAYLSPVNAINYLADKLAGTGGEADIVIMMVSGKTHDSFMVSLNKLVDVFPSPAFTSAEAGAVRRAAGCGEDANSGEIQSEFASGDPAIRAYKPRSPGGRSGEKAQQEAAAVADLTRVKTDGRV